jgi:hypothetical protein
MKVRFRGGGVISLDGELGGIGSIGSNSNTTLWTYRAGGSVPFWERETRGMTHAPQRLTVYSITSSARESNAGGLSRPSALAVLR